MAHRTIKIGNGWTWTDLGKAAKVQPWQPVHHSLALGMFKGEIAMVMQVTFPAITREEALAGIDPTEDTEIKRTTVVLHLN